MKYLLLIFTFAANPCFALNEVAFNRLLIKCAGNMDAATGDLRTTSEGIYSRCPSLRQNVAFKKDFMVNLAAAKVREQFGAQLNTLDTEKIDEAMVEEINSLLNDPANELTGDRSVLLGELFSIYKNWGRDL